MSHKSGHIIIQKLKELPITEDQRSSLSEIEARDQYTITDRLYLGYVTYVVAPEPAEE